jgi:hypothetical protein
MHEAIKNTRSDAQGILTAEQKAQIEQFRNERKTRREERRRRMKELRDSQPQ